MCLASQRAIQAILRLLRDRNEFTFDDLEKAVLDNGGIMQLGPGYKVVDLLADMERHGEIRRDSQGRYCRVGS